MPTSYCSSPETNAAQNGHSSVAEHNDPVKWVKRLRLSKEIKNPARDFADAVLVAEIVALFLPRYVTLSAFAQVHSLALKKYNWESLEKVVLRHLGIRLSQQFIESLAGAAEGAIEAFLPLLRAKINEALDQRRFRPSSRSRPSSRAGSEIYLDRIGGIGHEVESRATSKSPQSADEAIPPAPLAAVNHQQQRHKDKDALVEMLYARIRDQEMELAKKDEQIEALTQRVDKLVEMVFEGEMTVQQRGQSPFGKANKF